ncbi:MAG: hypothetical protein IJ214_06235 [Clostridia bacterium]|nr:hypothetical protein [Clostridia bacterium]
MKQICFFLILLALLGGPAARGEKVVVYLPTEAPQAAPVAVQREEDTWYDPAWYDQATGRLDLTGWTGGGAEALKPLLRSVPGLKYVDLSYCSLTNEELARLREELAPEGIKIVWTLTLKFGYTLRTDDWVFSTRHSSKDPRLEDEDVDCLRYATELRALDLGHNWIFNADFLAPMNELRVLILSDNKMDDLSCLAGKPLEYLEIFNTHVNDISFLYGCDTLLDINLCHTWVGDLRPLYRLKNLKRIWMGDAPMLTLAERKRFLACQEQNLEAYDFWTDIPTLYGWRGDENGPGHPRYEIIKAMFRENIYYDFNTVLRPDQYVSLYKK